MTPVEPGDTSSPWMQCPHCECRSEKESIARIKSILDAIEAGLYDRLLAKGPLSQEYADHVLKQIRLARDL